MRRHQPPIQVLIGDSIYASFDGLQITLTGRNGHVSLDRDTTYSLIRYLKEVYPSKLQIFD